MQQRLCQVLPGPRPSCAAASSASSRHGIHMHGRLCNCIWTVVTVAHEAGADAPAEHLDQGREDSTRRRLQVAVTPLATTAVAPLETVATPLLVYGGSTCTAGCCTPRMNAPCTGGSVLLAQACHPLATQGWPLRQQACCSPGCAAGGAIPSPRESADAHTPLCPHTHGRQHAHTHTHAHTSHGVRAARPGDAARAGTCIHMAAPSILLGYRD